MSVPLKRLALHNPHHTLLIYAIYAERIGDITALIEHCYENSGAANDKGDFGEDDEFGSERKMHHYGADELRAMFDRLR